METDYRQDAKDDALETVKNFQDQIVEQLIQKGEASKDLFNDYLDGDAYHHDYHANDYDLLESATLLHQLSEDKETDRGLWQGLDPEQAICAQASYTYSNAVMSEFQGLIEGLNDAFPIIIDDEGDEEERVKTFLNDWISKQSK